MAVPALAQLFAPLTRDQVLAAMLEVAQDLELPIEAYESGSVGRELLTIVAQAVADNTVTGSLAAGGGLLDYATFDWLSLLVYEVYGIERIPATFASGEVTLSNKSNTTYNPAAGDIRFIGPNGRTYTSTSGGTLAAGHAPYPPGTPAGVLVVSVVADETGTASNAQAGQVNQLATPLIGVTCSNAAGLFGTDEESDPALVVRARESLAKASPNGPRDAYSYIAKSATRVDGAPVGVTRVTVVQGNGTNAVYVASATGEVAGDTTDPLNNTTDLGRVNKAIQEQCVPTGITAEVLSAVARPTLVQATVFLSYTSSLSFEDAQALVLAQLLSYFSQVPIGGYSVPTASNRIFLEAIIGQIYESAPGQIVQVSLTAPTSNIVLAQEEVATLTSSATDITIQRALPNG